MRWSEWVRAHPFGSSLVGGLLAGCIAGLLWPIVVPPPGTQAQDAWVAPARLAAVQPKEAEFTRVRDARIWGEGNVAAAGSGAAATQWRLVAIIAGPSPVAMVAHDRERELKRVAIGQSLPDGGVVREVTADGLVYEREGCRYERILYAAAEAVVGSCASAPQSVPAARASSGTTKK